MTMTQSQATPERLFMLMNAYQHSAALRAAIEIDLFTAIGEGNRTVDALAKRCQATERGVRILCDFFVIQKILSKEGETYSLSPDAEMFLDTRSPAAIGTAVGFMLNPRMLHNFDNLTEAVRKGGVSDEPMETDHPMWTDFARHMAKLMFMPAEALGAMVTGGEAREMKVLDIAAGHGLFGIKVLEKNPQARVVAVDWPNVLAVARENVAKAAVGDRWETREGSAFEVDLGSGYDVILLTNFLHHFDAATNETLLKRLRAALKPDGKVFTLDFVPNEDRVSPPAAAAFSLVMLGNTAAGEAWTFNDLERMFNNAGFTRNALHALPPTFSQVVVSQP